MHTCISLVKLYLAPSVYPFEFTYHLQSICFMVTSFYLNMSSQYRIKLLCSTFPRHERRKEIFCSPAKYHLSNLFARFPSSKVPHLWVNFLKHTLHPNPGAHQLWRHEYIVPYKRHLIYIIQNSSRSARFLHSTGRYSKQPSRVRYVIFPSPPLATRGKGARGMMRRGERKNLFLFSPFTLFSRCLFFVKCAPSFGWFSCLHSIYFKFSLEKCVSAREN